MPSAQRAVERRRRAIGPPALAGILLLLLALAAATLFGSDDVSLSDAIAGAGNARIILLKYRLPRALFLRLWRWILPR